MRDVANVSLRAFALVDGCRPPLIDALFDWLLWLCQPSRDLCEVSEPVSEF